MDPFCLLLEAWFEPFLDCQTAQKNYREKKLLWFFTLQFSNSSQGLTRIQIQASFFSMPYFGRQEQYLKTTRAANSYVIAAGIRGAL